jgi:leucyl aminopeptidase
MPPAKSGPTTKAAGGTPVPETAPHSSAVQAPAATGTGGTERIDLADVALAHSAKAPDDAGTLGVPVFSGMELPDSLPVELDESWCRARGFTGKLGETIALPADDGTTVVAVGLGERVKVDAHVLRKAGAALAKAAKGETHLATNLASASLQGPEAAQAVVEGILLANYRFTKHKSASANGSGADRGLQRLTLVGGPASQVNKALTRAQALVRATVLARDLANEPAGTLTPTALANEAVVVGKRAGVKVTVWDEKKVAAERMGGLLGVAVGSDEPCRFVRMEYTPAGKSRGKLALVGKGITFDSGGLSLKSGEGMMTMKSDMSGAAAVLAAMSAIAELAPPVTVVGYLCCTENMPSGKATRPGDVLVTRSGKTIEVLNTDAEGRLVLADGLTVAVEERPDAVVDIATLTGAVVTALGKKVAGVMGTSDDLIDQVRSAGDRVGEAYWPLPLPDEYRSQIDSDVADIKNIGSGPQNGCITGGMVLKEFVEDVPWAHLDIAGTARADGDDGFIAKGCTGFGARTLAELACSFKKPR